MPHGMTWFDLIIPQLAQWREQLQEYIGTSYLGHAPISVQYVVGFSAVSLLIILLVLIARTKIANVEKGLVPDDRLTLRTFFEMMIEGTLNTMDGIMSRKHAVFFLPLVGTACFMIFFSNFLGLIPGFEPPTSNFNTTLAMAIIIFFVTHIYGIKENGFSYVAHFFGPIRKWYALPFMLMMFAIEVVSHLARPLSLAIRLAGNMFADHKVVATFTLLVPILVPVPMLLLGVLVCIVQVAVFCILSMVYIGMAVAHEEH
ncbi:MAG: F0F1 ATP synthase subunit A [Deltaproteobacteria bacterium]|nr:F0F1 ATP synthase subunit A [Deltaproteobacteria bacterium]MBN2673678.1 F0F1 ATP synthase subunit A [Deltaproteobacteria bacterium]